MNRTILLISLICLTGLSHAQDKPTISSRLLAKLDTSLINTDDFVVIEGSFWVFTCFDLNEAKKNALILNTIAFFIKSNPDIIFELSVHSDCRGETEFNNLLTQKRANVLKQWLINNGVEKSQLFAKGYGSERPLIDCDCKKKECSEETYDLNRRMELKILGASLQK